MLVKFLLSICIILVADNIKIIKYKFQFNVSEFQYQHKHLLSTITTPTTKTTTIPYENLQINYNELIEFFFNFKIQQKSILYGVDAGTAIGGVMQKPYLSQTHHQRQQNQMRQQQRNRFKFGSTQSSAEKSRWKTAKNANISILLDNLLDGYESSIRPGLGGPPVIVEVDVMVRSMGPISEVDMTYSMDCYFRQSWVDKRLAFKGAQDTLALSITMLERIWKPDTYFYNGKQSYLHTITTPNKFVRLHQDGRVLFSSRLTIKAGCPMNLEDFPMDVQKCPLKFGSFGYTTADVIYRWNKNRTVAIAEDMKLSQFDLVDCPSGNLTDIVYKTSFTRGNDGPAITISYKYSMLIVNFYLKRHMGNFLIQVYGPCCLLVVLSWVSFWLNREATADRISLGITVILTMTFLGLEARTDLPKVPYPTALDFFVFLSFIFIFATIIQFAIVHYYTKYGYGESYFMIDSDSESDSETDGEADETLKTLSRMSSEDLNASTETTLFEVIPLSACSVAKKYTKKRHRKQHHSWLRWECFRRKKIEKQEIEIEMESFDEQETSLRTPKTPRRRSHHYNYPTGIQTATNSPKPGRSTDVMYIDHHQHLQQQQQQQQQQQCQQQCQQQQYCGGTTSSGDEGTCGVDGADATVRSTNSQYKRRRKKSPQLNSVSKVDRASRLIFPLLFLIINVFYWTGYLSRSSAHLEQTTT